MKSKIRIVPSTELVANLASVGEKLQMQIISRMGRQIEDNVTPSILDTHGPLACDCISGVWIGGAPHNVQCFSNTIQVDDIILFEHSHMKLQVTLAHINTRL